MANQTWQLGTLLQSEGIEVRYAQTNPQYRPAWTARIRGIRAIVRLVSYIANLRRAVRDVDVVHVMANSGWSWHLSAVPAVWLAAHRGIPVVVNYRGGLAEQFLAKRAALIRRTMRHAAELIVPSSFLEQVFHRYGIRAQVIPNVVNMSLFKPAEDLRDSRRPHLVVARNLEHLYGIDVAIRAFAALRHKFPGLHLSIAGSGPERETLANLALDLDVADIVTFMGSLGPEAMAALYQSADIVVNPARADNAPNSILEALACGVPVVSSNVGGVSHLVRHGSSALLVAPDSPDELAEAVARLLTDGNLRRALVQSGLDLVSRHTWVVVRPQWLGLYARIGRVSADTVESSRQVL